MLKDAARQAVLRELASCWRQDNVVLFGGEMSPAGVRLSDLVALGRWVPSERCIDISERLVTEAPWGVVVEVLRHEMAHQYVHEVLGMRSEGPHGPRFRQVCADRCIDGRAAGMPEPGTTRSSKVLDRIRKLLALAGSPEEHEARAAMRAAKRLMLEHNLELSRLDAPATYTFRQVGPVRARTPKHERLLAGILSKHFFVQAIWVPGFDVTRSARGRILELCGSESNLDIAAYVHEYVLRTGESLWRQHKRRQGITADRDRRAFLEGVMVGFWEQLEDQAEESEQRGLVWLGDPGLQDFFGRRHPRVRRTASSPMRSNAAHHAGRAAGRELVVHKGVEVGDDRGLRLTRRDRR